MILLHQRRTSIPTTTAHWSTENSNRRINSVGTFKKFQRACTKTLIDFHQIMIGFFQSPQFPIDVLGFHHNFMKKCRYLKLDRKCTQICTFWLRHELCEISVKIDHLAQFSIIFCVDQSIVQSQFTTHDRVENADARS